MAGEEKPTPVIGSFDDLNLEGISSLPRANSGGTLNEVTSLEAVYDEQGDLEDLLIRNVQPTFTQVTGIEPEQAEGKRITQIFGSLDILTPYRQAVIETLDSGKSRQLEVYFPPLDKHYQVMLVPVDTTRFIALADDISPQRKAAETLRVSEAQFRLILTNTSVTVFTMDCNLRYTWVFNASAGLTIEDIVGKRDEEVLDPESAAIVTEPKRQVLATGRGLRTELAFTIRGLPVVKDVILEPLSDKAGKLIGLTGVSLDITEQRLLESRNLENAARMEVQRRLSEQREQERLQIARDLHDGPVQDLIGVMSTVKQLLSTTKDRTIAEGLQGILNKIQVQVQELRFFTSELRPPLLAKFGLRRAIHAHTAVLSRNDPELRFNLDLEEESSPLPENLRITLYRIYQEAISNITRHAHAKEVWISFRMEPTGPLNEVIAVLEIRDNGVGFHLPARWIDLARQGHLGLVGMRERAEAAGGTIHITSSPGGGTTLRITIPAPKG